MATALAPARPVEPALAAYETLAPFYDGFTAAYRHDVWLERVEEVVRALGLRGSRLLDVACGTGKSFAPMLERGWDVTACDLSPAMVERARRRHPAGAFRVFVADMRELPPCGPFDLVTCLDDAVNYLLEPEDLGAALRSIAGVLRPGGMVVFDCNSLLTYSTTFAGEFEVDGGDAPLRWRGEAGGRAESGGLFSAVIDGGGDHDLLSRHVQRHHPPPVIERLLREAGLELLESYGQLTGARLVQPVDEDEHPKLLYVARSARRWP